MTDTNTHTLIFLVNEFEFNVNTYTSKIIEFFRGCPRGSDNFTSFFQVLLTLAVSRTVSHVPRFNVSITPRFGYVNFPLRFGEVRGVLGVSCFLV